MKSPLCSRPLSDAHSRREFLYGLGSSMGSVAFSSLLAEEVTASPMAPKKPMTPAKAKNVIMLFMEGGPGHMDTFDPKPKLTQLHKTESKNDRGLAAGNYQFYVGSPFEFKKPDNPEWICVINGNTCLIPKWLMNSATTVGAKPSL